MLRIGDDGGAIVYAKKHLKNFEAMCKEFIQARSWSVAQPQVLHAQNWEIAAVL